MNEQMLSEMHHDLVVMMQAAYIEWLHGKGAEEAMTWISNTLDASLIPGDDELYGKDAQAYFEANRMKPFPRCFCGRPSNPACMGLGFCSEEPFQANEDAES